MKGFDSHACVQRGLLFEPHDFLGKTVKVIITQQAVLKVVKLALQCADVRKEAWNGSENLTNPVIVLPNVCVPCKLRSPQSSHCPLAFQPKMIPPPLASKQF